MEAAVAVAPKQLLKITLEIVSVRFPVETHVSCVVSCAAADFICFVSVFFLFLCSVCFAYQSVRNQTQKCCVILHCRQQQQKQQQQNKTKETERKKKVVQTILFMAL